MLTVGNVKLTKDREKALEVGGIICLLENDKVRTFWHGIGRGRDFMLVQSVDGDGVRWVMGRVRIHANEKLVDSDDHKEVIQVAFGSDVPDNAIALCVESVKGLAVTMGVEVVAEFDAKMCGPEEFHKLLKTVMNKTGGRMAEGTIDPQTGERVWRNGK